MLAQPGPRQPERGEVWMRPIHRDRMSERDRCGAGILIDDLDLEAAWRHPPHPLSVAFSRAERDLRWRGGGYGICLECAGWQGGEGFAESGEEPLRSVAGEADGE